VEDQAGLLSLIDRLGMVSCDGREVQVWRYKLGMTNECTRQAIDWYEMRRMSIMDDFPNLFTLVVFG